MCSWKQNLDSALWMRKASAFPVTRVLWEKVNSKTKSLLIIRLLHKLRRDDQVMENEFITISPLWTLLRAPILLNQILLFCWCVCVMCFRYRLTGVWRYPHGHMHVGAKEPSSVSFCRRCLVLTQVLSLGPGPFRQGQAGRPAASQHPLVSTSLSQAVATTPGCLGKCRQPNLEVFMASRQIFCQLSQLFGLKMIQNLSILTPNSGNNENKYIAERSILVAGYLTDMKSIHSSR